MRAGLKGTPQRQGGGLLLKIRRPKRRAGGAKQEYARLDEEDVVEVFKASEKYGVNALTEQCAEMMVAAGGVPLLAPMTSYPNFKIRDLAQDATQALEEFATFH